MCTTPTRQPKAFLRDSTSLWELRRVIATYTRVYCELWQLNYEKHTRKDDKWVFWYKYRYKINFLAQLDPHISPQSEYILLCFCLIIYRWRWWKSWHFIFSMHRTVILKKSGQLQKNLVSHTNTWITLSII